MTVDEQNIFTVHIEYKETIPLLEFKEFLEGINNQYRNHVLQTNDENKNDALLIKEIAPGSIDIHLVSSIMPLFSDINNVATFFNSIRHLMTWLSTLKGQKPIFTNEDVKDIIDIVKPAKNIDRSIKISTTGDKNQVLVIDKVFAEKIIVNVPSVLDQMKQAADVLPEVSLEKNNAVLRFQQIEKEEKNNKNTKGIIDEIDKKPYPVMFAEGLKNPIIRGDPNPLKKNYLVDIKIQRVDNKIKSYTVLKIRDSYIDENSEHSEKSLFGEKE